MWQLQFGGTWITLWTHPIDTHTPTLTAQAETKLKIFHILFEVYFLERKYLNSDKNLTEVCFLESD